MIDIRLHAYLRAHAESNGAERVGPFVASFDAHSVHPYRNYAIPDDQARPDAVQVEALIAAFTARGRTPRLEYLPGLCPGVEPALVAAGFAAERRLAVLACAPEEVLDVATPPGIELLLARTEDQLRTAAEVQNEAYGVDTTEDADVARLRGVVTSGGLVALARDATSGRAGRVGTPHHPARGRQRTGRRRRPGAVSPPGNRRRADRAAHPSRLVGRHHRPIPDLGGRRRGTHLPKGRLHPHHRDAAHLAIMPPRSRQRSSDGQDGQAGAETCGDSS